MNMKKLLCAGLSLTLLSISTAAFAETDLQSQLDEANARIAELEEQVETYYPYYSAQIVATYGTDGIVWLDDVQPQYDEVEAQYTSYGISVESYGMVDSVKTDIVKTAVRNGVIDQKAVELGLDQLDEETTAELESSAQETYDYYIQYYLNYYYADAEEITDDMRAEAIDYWNSVGYTYDTLYASLRTNAIDQAVFNYVTKDVSVDEADIQNTYEAQLADDESSYSDNDSAFNSARNKGTTIAWNPEGYRLVKQILIKFDDTQSSTYSDLQSTLKSLQDEKDAIENPSETAAAEATATPEATEAPKRSLEEVNADIDACMADLDALYAELMPKAEEAIAAFDAGTDFDTLISQYNDDPGMTNEPTASQGYAVCADNTVYDPAFAEAAMSIAEKGQISGAANGQYGIYIVYYMDDLTPGAVALEDIHDGIADTALTNKQQSTYDDQLAAWVEEAAPVYYLENFGVTATEDATAEEPVVEETTAEETTTEVPAAEEAATEATTTEEPVAEETTAAQ